MSRGSHDAEAVITFRAENEASEEIEDIRQETDDANKSFSGLNRGLITAGLGFLGLSFGAKEVVDSIGEVARSGAAVDFQLSLLGPSAERAHRDMSGSFDDIADDVAATEREVSEAFGIIIANSGDIAPSVEELTGAFDLARLTGNDFETTAAAIGQALQGNLEPLNQLLDPSGRKSIPSLEAALATAAGVADEAITPIDRLSASFREMGDNIGEGLAEPQRGLENLKQDIDDIAGAIERLLLFGGERRPTELDRFRLRLPPSEVFGKELQGLQDAGIIGPLGPLTPVTPVTINNFGPIDSDERLNDLVRKVEQIIRNNNRNGVNVSAP